MPCVRWVTVMLLALAACTTSAAGEPSSESVVSSTADAADGSAVTAPGSDAPSITFTTSVPPSSTTSAVYPEGFTTAAAVATAPDGSTCELCVWLADTGDRRSRGLMFVTDLGPADAMAFRYPQPHSGSFWMKNTLLPLSIVFYSPDGVFMEAFDMAPCTSDPCPSYRTPSGFLVAVEVPQGALDELGLVAGSTLELLDVPCNT